MKYSIDTIVNFHIVEMMNKNTGVVRLAIQPKWGPGYKQAYKCLPYRFPDTEDGIKQANEKARQIMPALPMAAVALRDKVFVDLINAPISTNET